MGADQRRLPFPISVDQNAVCVRWYCRYSLSYRDVEEMMRDGRQAKFVESLLGVAA